MRSDEIETRLQANEILLQALMRILLEAEPVLIETMMAAIRQIPAETPLRPAIRKEAAGIALQRLAALRPAKPQA